MVTILLNDYPMAKVSPILNGFLSVFSHNFFSYIVYIGWINGPIGHDRERIMEVHDHCFFFFTTLHLLDRGVSKNILFYHQGICFVDKRFFFR